jgi:hypothetical protein
VNVGCATAALKTAHGRAEGRGKAACPAPSSADPDPALAELSELALRPTVQRAVAAVRELLDLDVAYTGEIVGDTQHLRLADGDQASFRLPDGGSLPVAHTICRRVLDGEAPQLMPDVAEVAAVRELFAAGTARMFDVMKAAALIHKPTTPAYWQWPTAMDILRMGTLGGAKSALIGDITGSLEVGKQADLVIFDATTYNFLPFHDAEKHLVYSENGSSVETVMVGGEIVVRDRKLTKSDEAEVLGEIRQELPALTGQYLREESLGQNMLEKYYAEINRRCNAEDVGINRYIEAEESWAGDLAEARFV